MVVVALVVVVPPPLRVVVLPRELRLVVVVGLFYLIAPEVAHAWTPGTHIYLGESVLAASLAIQTVIGGEGVTLELLSVIAGGLLILYSMWWIYFDRTEEAAREVIFSSDDLGRVALSAYTYFHIPMIVGIIAVGAADELTLAHPGDRTSAALVALTLGVTALALAGHALFKRGIFGVLS